MSDNTDTTNVSILDRFKEDYQSKSEESFSITDWLDQCKEDEMLYANAAERLYAAFGEPEIVDTRNEKGEMGRIFHGQTIRRYPAFSDFYGMETVIQKIADHLKGAAAMDEHSKQALFLLGPPSGGKSALGERIRELMEQHPISVLRCKKTEELSPVFESPLGLFKDKKYAEAISDEFGIPKKYFKTGLSPWAVKRLEEAKGDMADAFDVVKIWPSQAQRIAIAKVDAGDENNQDVTDLIGKLDINKLGEGLDQNDPDAYLYSGGLNRGNQGVFEFVEMLKGGSLKTLNPLLEALQGRHYNASEDMGSLPFTGFVFAHTNLSEWSKFVGANTNEAFFDRFNVVYVPYTMRYDEEMKIYEKEFSHSDLADKPMAPRTLEYLAKFAVMSRLSDVEALQKFDPLVKAEVLNGKVPEGASGSVPSIGTLRDNTPKDEGMSGISTRFATKSLSATFNANAHTGEVEADPALLFDVLRQRINEDAYMNDGLREKALMIINKHLSEDYAEFIKEELIAAFVGASDERFQRRFDRFVNMAEAWLDGEDFRDEQSMSDNVMSKSELDKELSMFEQAAGIPNAKDFRGEVVRYVRTQQAKTGEPVHWTSYRKLGEVIRKSLTADFKDVIAAIKYDGPSDKETGKKREAFFENMQDKGYTPGMIKRAAALCENKFG